ncbi:hypothetical protein CONLIGDRAFT_653902 [Coniochaeta ligniaria NRRL 30616]|uniref:Ribosomal protein s17 n=1 Tax=Coniochaeta ligniaria NRRL 30616 TaxID=1408157 RepID=A0A1J7JDI8_9PEZI|nr:hypothetical protein CONLIGDRAFT_653902 [Coniochaeta ligniaria NRRL 30616]
MLVKTALVALMGLAIAAEGASIHHTPTMNRLSRRQNKNNGKNNGNAGNTGNAGNNNANAGSATCLAANALQTGSQSTGQNNAVAADGQVNSLTDNANFINFCSGKTLTNGLQNTGGSCNGVVMGDIPAVANMVSTIITNPKNLDTIPEKTTFNIQVSVANMALGSFTNATSTYYTAPQQLDGSGKIIGHTHMTVQDLGNSLNPTAPLDGQKFVFFKGINDAGDGKGNLQAVVTGGLPAGNYRVCSMAGASNHQPVLMAVAQRGAQDDCKYFTVAAAGANSGNAAGGTNNAAAGGNGKGSSAASSSAAAASTSAAAAAGNGGGRGGKGKGNGAGAAAAATSAASSSAAAATTSAAAAAGGKGSNKGGKGKGAGANTAAATTSAAAAATSAAASTGGKGGKGAAGTNNAATGADAGAAGAIGGIAAPAVTNTGDSTRAFSVNGDTFVNEAAAKQRACAIQNNQCADAVNSGKVTGPTVGDCNAQETACNAA